MKTETSMQQIHIESLPLQTIIGTYGFEQKVLQRVELTAVLTPQCSFEDMEDNIAHAVDYAEVVAKLTEFATAQKTHLIETLVSEMADFLLHHFALKAVHLKLRKPGVLLNGGCVMAELQREAL